MRFIMAVGAACAMIAVTGSALAQQPVRIRGTISSLEGNVLTVKARDGKDMKVSLPENLTVVAAKALTLADVKPGDFVGPASRVKPDGTLDARHRAGLRHTSGFSSPGIVGICFMSTRTRSCNGLVDDHAVQIVTRFRPRRVLDLSACIGIAGLPSCVDA